MDSTGKVQTVDSSWSLPLPLKEYAMSRVTVYFYSDRWVPIKGNFASPEGKFRRQGNFVISY